MKLSKISKWIIGLVLFVAIAFFIDQRRHAAHEAAPSTTSAIGTVTKEDLIQRVTISGQVWPKKRLDIRPSFGGYITKLYVKVGEHVGAKDPIVTFSPSLSSGEQNFPIRAGFEGTVTQVLKSEGEYVVETATDALTVRVEDLSQLSVSATVPELDIAKVKIGQEALVRISALAGETFKAKINEISLSARDRLNQGFGSSSVDFAIKAPLESHDKRLMTGMSALMDVITAKREGVLVLGQEYVQQGADKTYVVMENGEKRDITTGLQTDEAVEITSGVKEGERVRPIDFATLPPVPQD